VRAHVVTRLRGSREVWGNLGREVNSRTSYFLWGPKPGRKLSMGAKVREDIRKSEDTTQETEARRDKETEGKSRERGRED